MGNSYRIKLIKEGQKELEDWWIRMGKQYPKPASRAAEIRNQVSFVNYDLQKRGFSKLKPTSIADEFILEDVAADHYDVFVNIVDYHGFGVISEV